MLALTSGRTRNESDFGAWAVEHSKLYGPNRLQVAPAERRLIVLDATLIGYVQVGLPKYPLSRLSKWPTLFARVGTLHATRYWHWAYNPFLGSTV